MTPSWSDSAFILTFDESGGLYDHVAPLATVSPDGIKPKDLMPETSAPPRRDRRAILCTPAIASYVVSVCRRTMSRTPRLTYRHSRADRTSVWRRQSYCPGRTAEAMTEFFDFNNPSWLTRTPPAQLTDGRCYLNALP